MKENRTLFASLATFLLTLLMTIFVVGISNEQGAQSTRLQSVEIRLEGVAKQLSGMKENTNIQLADLKRRLENLEGRSRDQ